MVLTATGDGQTLNGHVEASFRSNGAIDPNLQTLLNHQLHALWLHSFIYFYSTFSDFTFDLAVKSWISTFVQLIWDLSLLQKRVSFCKYYILLAIFALDSEAKVSPILMNHWSTLIEISHLDKPIIIMEKAAATDRYAQVWRPKLISAVSDSFALSH